MLLFSLSKPLTRFANVDIAILSEEWNLRIRHVAQTILQDYIKEDGSLVELLGKSICDVREPSFAT